MIPLDGWLGVTSARFFLANCTLADEGLTLGPFWKWPIFKRMIIKRLCVFTAGGKQQTLFFSM
jgi:hypothetical protein